LVYIGSYDGNLYTFDAATRQQKWVSPTGAVVDTSSPAVANGLVYIGSYDGKLYTFSL
jgi:outer membrane protein assembly factor BamB